MEITPNHPGTMKSSRSPVSHVWLIVLILLVMPAAVLALGPHPSVLNLKVGDAWHPVVGMQGGDPVYWNGQAEVRYRLFGDYDLGRTARFAPASVEITDSHGERNFITGFDFRLKANATIKGGFLVVVAFDSGFFEGRSYPHTQHVVRPLPDLPAGQEVRVNFVASRVFSAESAPDQKRLYFPLVFTPGGIEARTNRWEMAALYFHFINLYKLGEVLDKYGEKFAGADRPAMPFIKIPPYLPDDAPRPVKAVNAILSVGESGVVTAVKLPADLPADLDKPLREALAEWLFLPRLKAGKAVPCKVEVPVQF